MSVRVEVKVEKIRWVRDQLVVQLAKFNNNSGDKSKH